MCHLHWGHRCDRGTDPLTRTTTFQHHSPPTRPPVHRLCFPASSTLGGGWSLCSFHTTRSEPWIFGPRLRSTHKVCARPVHRHNGVRIHFAPVSVPRGLSDRLLRPLPYDQHRHVKAGGKPDRVLQQCCLRIEEPGFQSHQGVVLPLLRIPIWHHG